MILKLGVTMDVHLKSFTLDHELCLNVASVVASHDGTSKSQEDDLINNSSTWFQSMYNHFFMDMQ